MTDGDEDVSLDEELEQAADLEAAKQIAARWETALLEDHAVALAELAASHDEELARVAGERDVAQLEAEEQHAQFKDTLLSVGTLERELAEERDRADRLAFELDQATEGAARQATTLEEERLKSIIELEARDERALAALTRERDAALAKAAAVTDDVDELRQMLEFRASDLDQAERRYEATHDELMEVKQYVNGLAAELQEVVQSAERQTAALDQDHRKALADILDDHERQMAEMASERDGAWQEAERAAAERETARQALDAELAEAKQQAELEAERLMAERDAALDEVDHLAKDWRAAAELAERLAGEHEVAEQRTRRESTQAEADQDKFIEELLEDHDRDLAVLGSQRDEAQALSDAVARQLAEAREGAERLATALGEERDNAAQIAADREAAAKKADRLAEEREASTREQARVAAEQDEFLAELLEGHDRGLAAAKRERDFAKQQAKATARELAELKITIMRLKGQQAGS
ncbi:MAG: hypothetical protein JRI68_00205 [Deltaproteobacteria bacterium]|nr:hypothetical protein [Deltaproteobacteria bacterium]